MTEVKPGQVWAQQSQPGRLIRIDAIADGKASCTNLTNSHEVQAYLDQVAGGPAPAGKYYGDKRGTVTRISLATLARKDWQPATGG